VCLFRARSPCPDRPPTWRLLVGPRERGYKRPVIGGPGVWFRRAEGGKVASAASPGTRPRPW
jgi:hypothetical protein